MRCATLSLARGRTWFRPAALLVACLLGLPAAGLDVVEEALTDEDVVRLFISGEPVERIIEQIRASEVNFDTSEEMQEELRRAGLPPVLLRAMTDRQQEIDRQGESDEEGAPEEDAPPVLNLLVRLNPNWEPTEKRPRPVVRVLDLVDPRTHERLRLRDADAVYTDVAIALLCRTQDHVPDHWRSQSPLGRDFVNAPRHRLLSFVSGAEREEPGQLSRLATKVVTTMTGDDVPETALLVLEIPETVDARVESQVIHDLTVALALQVEGRFYLVAWDNIDDVEIGDEPTVLDVTISGKGDGEEGPAGLGVSIAPPRAGDD